MAINPTHGSDDRCEMAVTHLRQAIKVERRLPTNVFLDRWSSFYVFDADWMRVPDAVQFVKALLDAEGGRCACVWKLDCEEPGQPEFFYVHEKTSADEYQALLRGDTPGFGWLDAMERLACASDVGEWCIYCEPNNEIAVIAFRQPGASARYSSAMERVHATHFEDATREPALSYGFSKRALSREWRDQFLREYRTRNL